jgi:hypothetical protein
MADSSSSADGSPAEDAVKTYIIFTVNSPSATVSSLDTLRFFFGPFLTRNGHTPPRVAIAPHIRNQQQFAVSLCLFYCFFIKDALVRCLLNPPLHSSCKKSASPAAATAHKPLGTEQTHVVPVKEPLPL